MFKVALVGKPNVGKSTLFNRMVGKQLSLTNDTPGLTRDIKESKASLIDMEFSLLDTGGYEEHQGIIASEIWKKIQEATNEVNLILFLLDGRSPLTREDYFMVDYLRKLNKDIIVCVNKSEGKDTELNSDQFYSIGFTNICFISASHNQGMGDLYHLMKPYYAKFYNDNLQSDFSNQSENSHELSLAFVGKPNVGKSTIINNIINQERLITSDIMGTTRDSIDINFDYKGLNFKIIDTAGMRRKAKIVDHVEKLTVVESLRSIRYINVAVLVISADEGLTKQDLSIARHIVEEGRALIVVVNKMDLIKKNKSQFLQNIAIEIEDNFFQIKKPYIIGISALKDEDISNILDKALEVYQKWQFSISTGALNNWIFSKVLHNPPPMIKRRRVKIKYATQIKTRPPTINIWSNALDNFPDSYLRYIQNEFFKDFNLWGVTLRINIRKSDNPYKK